MLLSIFYSVPLLPTIVKTLEKPIDSQTFAHLVEKLEKDYAKDYGAVILRTKSPILWTKWNVDPSDIHKKKSELHPENLPPKKR